MEKTNFIQVGDKITSAKYGRWLIVAIEDDGFIIMVKMRKGKITETFRVRSDKVFS